MEGQACSLSHVDHNLAKVGDRLWCIGNVLTQSSLKGIRDLVANLAQLIVEQEQQVAVELLAQLGGLLVSSACFVAQRLLRVLLESRLDQCCGLRAKARQRLARASQLLLQLIATGSKDRLALFADLCATMHGEHHLLHRQIEVLVGLDDGPELLQEVAQAVGRHVTSKLRVPDVSRILGVGESVCQVD